MALILGCRGNTGAAEEISMATGAEAALLQAHCRSLGMRTLRDTERAEIAGLPLALVTMQAATIWLTGRFDP
jgi:hypothetical protein